MIYGDFSVCVSTNLFSSVHLHREIKLSLLFFSPLFVFSVNARIFTQIVFIILLHE